MWIWVDGKLIEVDCVIYEPFPKSRKEKKKGEEKKEEEKEKKDEPSQDLQGL